MPPDFLNKVHTVRSIYNHAKDHHRWKEKLPERDLELEYWWAVFLQFKEWAQRRYSAAVEECNRRGISIEEWCKEKTHSGKHGSVVSSVIRKLKEIRTDPPDMLPAR